MKATDAERYALAGLEREPRLIGAGADHLNARRLRGERAASPAAVLAPDRGHDAPVGLEQHAQALQGAVEVHRQDLAGAERSAVQLLLVLGELDVLRAHHGDHFMIAARVALHGAQAGAAGDETLAEPQPGRAAVAEE